jgi:hypothetical protein
LFVFNAGTAYDMGPVDETSPFSGFYSHLQKSEQYTSPICSVSGTTGITEFTSDDDMIWIAEIDVRYIDGKWDKFYTYMDERRYMQIPNVKYYIFEYIYDTLYDGTLEKDRFEYLTNVKVIQGVKIVEDDNLINKYTDLLRNMECIPYISPLLYIENVNERTILTEYGAFEYIEINVIYWDYGEDTYYSKDFKYEDFLGDNKLCMFNYHYGTIGNNLLEDGNLSNVKVITGIRRDLKAFPPDF